MYSEQTRNDALRLVSQGLTPREASRRLGGRPGHAIIRLWAQGFEPTGNRRSAELHTVDEKLDTLRRLEAGEAYQEVAEDLGVSPCTVLNWRRLYRDGGEEALVTRIDRFVGRP